MSGEQTGVTLCVKRLNAFLHLTQRPVLFPFPFFFFSSKQHILLGTEIRDAVLDCDLTA